MSSLVSAGKVEKLDPLSFYHYALTDPTDKPYATFQFLYKTQGTFLITVAITRSDIHSEELNELGVSILDEESWIPPPPSGEDISDEYTAGDNLDDPLTDTNILPPLNYRPLPTFAIEQESLPKSLSTRPQTIRLVGPDVIKHTLRRASREADLKATDTTRNAAENQTWLRRTPSPALSAEIKFNPPSPPSTHKQRPAKLVKKVGPKVKHGGGSPNKLKKKSSCRQ